MGKASGSFKQTERLLMGKHPVSNQGFAKPSLLRFAVAASTLEEAEEQIKVRAASQMVIDMGPLQEGELEEALEHSLAAHREWLQQENGGEHEAESFLEESSLADQVAFFGEEAF